MYFITPIVLFLVPVTSLVLTPREQKILTSAKESIKQPASTNANKPCTFLNQTSELFYDLNRLSKSGGDYILEVPEDKIHKKRTFRLNICHALISTKTGLKDPTEVAASVEEDGSIESLGKTSSELALRDNNVIISYEQGDNCPGLSKRRKTLILLTCDRTRSDTGVPVYVTDFDNCNYVFEWKTPAACPVRSGSDSEDMGGWSIFFKLATISGLVYLFVGILYNRFLKGAQGLEQLPHFRFWYDIYDFVKDMTLIIALKAWDFIVSLKGKMLPRYRSVPRSDNHTLINDDDDF